MGIDAYALDHRGKHLEEEPSGEGTRLTNERYRDAFAVAVKLLAKDVGMIDGDFPVGGLCITANASATNHVLYATGQHADQHRRYSAAQVATAATRLDQTLPLPDYVANDEDAITTAKAFIRVCAQLGLAIEISP